MKRYKITVEDANKSADEIYAKMAELASEKSMDLIKKKPNISERDLEDEINNEVSSFYLSHRREDKNAWDKALSMFGLDPSKQYRETVIAEDSLEKTKENYSEVYDLLNKYIRADNAVKAAKKKSVSEGDTKYLSESLGQMLMPNQGSRTTLQKAMDRRDEIDHKIKELGFRSADDAMTWITEFSDEVRKKGGWSNF